jgi:transcriptional regulator with XRE-family HTH domain
LPGVDLSTLSTHARYGLAVWWRKKTEVSEFLYKLLVTDAPKGYARQVAAKMGVPYPTLSKYWQGKRVFPAALVRALYHATDQDPRVVEFFVPAGEPAPLPDLSRAVMTLASLEAKVTDLYLRATAPDSEAGEQVSTGEADALRVAVQQLIAHAEKLQAALFIRTGSITSSPRGA